MKPLRIRPPDHGALFVVAGPTGAGKSTLVAEAVSRVPGLSFSVSATTRPPRPGEREGVDYHFIDEPTFVSWIAEDAFLEHAHVYDRRYGTPRRPVEAALSAGRSILLDVDLAGTRQVRARIPDAVTIFVLPPDLGTLEKRLLSRGDDPEVIRRRLVLANEQIAGVGEFDYIIVNDDLEAARAVFTGILLATLHHRARRGSEISRVLAELRAPRTP
jgi:guanylate kinase